MQFPNKNSRVFVLTMLGFICTSAGTAATIIDIPGPTIGYFDFAGGALADSWTQNFAVTDGSISVYIQGTIPDGGDVHFYISTAIGPTATLADLIAFTTVSVPTDDLTLVTPFTGLNLGPGTYYLVAADYDAVTNELDGPDWNYYSGDAGVDTASGISLLTALYSADTLSMFAPASNFTLDMYDERGTLDFTGNIIPVTSAPEPSTMWLLGGALLAVAVFRAKSLRRQRDPIGF